MLNHIRLLTNYNARFNRQVYDAAARLDDSQFHEDRGAFFKSVCGTLNHILVGDILWFTRFYHNFKAYPVLAPVQNFPRPESLDHVPFPEFADLRSAREKMDGMISQWAHHDLSEEDLTRDLQYTNTKGVASSRNFAETIMHVFNHHTHHRGQASTLLLQLGQDVGATDFLLDIPES
jgi:uncharacterized damage-inducible protein DinB